MDFIVRHRMKGVPDTGSKSRPILYDNTRTRKKFTSYFGEKVWFLILIFYVVVFLVVIYSDVVRFPTPVSVDDLKTLDIPRSSIFSEERARNFAIELSSLGSKPTGSYENEVLAVDYLLRQLNHIKNHLKPSNKIEIDIQKTSGCFPLHFKDGMTSCYSSIKNIVAKIGPVHSTNHSLLVNCHYDSVPTSPGASDDGVSCAMMLEVLMSLSQENKPLKHSVVFLFNGAEENMLQAAHGFITQHKWAKEVVGFINLEACGAGGKQMMFQADKERTWLIQAYAEGASYPQGSVVAQDIFQSGIVISDTDYRIFQQFGGLPGLDFAYVKNGYVYHTKYDTPFFINSGAIQQAGDNLLNLIHECLKSPAMLNPQNQPYLPLVFFDFLGFFMVVYPVSVACISNVIIVFMMIADMFMKAKRYDHSGSSLITRLLQVGKASLLLLMSFVCALLLNGAIAILLGVFGNTMAWYRSPILIAGLYGCSSLVAILGIHTFVRDSKNTAPREDWLREDIYFDAARLLWTVLLITMQLANLNSSFICSAFICFPTVIRSICDRLFNLTGLKGTPKSHMAVHLIMQIIPLLLLFYCVWSMYTVFIPILGRIGATINPDVVISLFTVFIVFFATVYMFSLVQVTTSIRKVLFALISTALATFLLICCTSVGFPYTGNTQSPAPLRCYILHTERTHHNVSGTALSKDSGYWVVPLDYNGPSFLSPYIPGLKDASPVNCDGELSCGMPFSLPVVSLLSKSYYVPASKPKIHGSHKFELISKDVIGQGLHRLSFKVTGPDHITVVLSPFKGIKLVEWSLYIGTPLPGIRWNDRQTYFIYYSYGEYTEPWEFSIVLKVPKTHVESSPFVDLLFVTHYIHSHDAITGDFPSLLNNLPSWVHATPWTCTLDVYKI